MSTVPQRDGSRAVRANGSVVPVHDLEEFWPSRRFHAYDEFCR